MEGTVVAVSAGAAHGLTKSTRASIRLLDGLGVEGDSHAGATVQHRSRVRQDPSQTNLRQVHLIGEELYDELREGGFDITVGQMGENVATRGIDLLRLPQRTRLSLGEEAVIEVTGLRNPCKQLDGLQPGLMAATLGRDSSGGLVRRAGIMGVVLSGGGVRAGDSVSVELPDEPHQRLEKV